jgi:hypothetical protein
MQPPFSVFHLPIFATFHPRLVYSSTLMMEAAHSSEMSVNIYQTTWRRFPKSVTLHSDRLTNLKSHNKSLKSLSYIEERFSYNRSGFWSFPVRINFWLTIQ